MTEFPQSRISSAEGSSMFTYYASRRWHCQPSRRHLRKDLRILLARRENQLDIAKTDRKRWIARTRLARGIRCPRITDCRSYFAGFDFAAAVFRLRGGFRDFGGAPLRTARTFC